MAELAEYLPEHEEALKLTERILEFCTDNEIRDYAAYQECSLLFILGRKNEALAKTKKLPGMEYCRELNIPHLLYGEERAIQCQKTIRLLGWAFFGQIEQLEDSGVFLFEDRLAIYQKAIDMYNVIYDDGDMCYTHLRMYRCYFHMGGLCLENEFTDRAAVYYEKAAVHAKAFDELPEKVQFTSLLLNRISFDLLKTGKDNVRSLSCEMLDGLGKYSEKLKDNNKFDAILAMLK